MKKNIIILSFAAIGMLMTSCAPKKDLDACKLENQSLTTKYDELASKNQANLVALATANERIRGLEEQLRNSQNAITSLQNNLDKSLAGANDNNVSISKLVDQINESNQYIRHIMNAKDTRDSLSLVLANNLTRNLTAEELKEVNINVQKAVVYISLADNMLYKSGSYVINDRAEKTLAAIAKIIADYKDYDVLVEGNTDDVPISRENIRNNWDLSCLRASSVVQYLIEHFNVEPKRLTAGGRGEFNPLVSNDTEVGKQRNRRTQIIITPKLDEFMDLIGKGPAEK